mgnify:CR=1 FL=1
MSRATVTRRRVGGLAIGLVLPAALLFLALLPTLAVAPARAAERERCVFLHYWTGCMSGGIDDMVASFAKERPDIEVKATGFEHESFKVGIKVMLASGNPPDLFSYWAGARVQALVREGYLAPIDDVWAEAKLDGIFPKAVARACVYNGKPFAVPLTRHVVGFFYNRKLLDQVGGQPPATWAEFTALCARLKAAGITPIALGAREKWPAQFWFDLLLLNTAGPEYRQRLMDGEASYLDPAVARVFATWKGMLDAGWFTAHPGLRDWDEAAKLVHQGQAAMTLMGTWVIGLFQGQLGWREGQDFDFFPFPALEPDLPGVALGPMDVVVAAREGNLAAAKRVMAFFSGVEPQERMSQGSGALAPSAEVPAAFYSDLKRRILAMADANPHWAFNYDLATPHEVAMAGLETFAAFLNAPGEYPVQCQRLQDRAAAVFAAGK